MQSDSKIFVTGHRGLYGKALCKRLKEKGYNNIVTVDRTELDLTRQKDVEEWFTTHRPEYVFHLAAKTGGIGAGNGGTSIITNVQIDSNILNCCRLFDVSKLFFPGSNCSYPMYPKLPITEDQIMTGHLEPSIEGYATAKIMTIKMCEQFNKQFNLDYVVAMPCNLYGPNDKFDKASSHVMASMISKFCIAKEQNDNLVTFWGDGSQLREFLYCDDAADAAIHLMNLQSSHKIFNVASGNEVTLKSLASTIKAIAKYEGAISWDITKPIGTPKKGLDITKIKNTGWHASVTLEQGLSQTIEYFRKNVLQNWHNVS